MIDSMVNPVGENLAIASYCSVATSAVSPSWTMSPNATTGVATLAAFR